MDIKRMKQDMKHAVRLAESAEKRGDDFVLVDVNLLFGLAVDLNMLIQSLERTQKC